MKENDFCCSELIIQDIPSYLFYETLEDRKVFNNAYQKGFTLWDTAPVYGLGNSEKLLGAFPLNNDNIIISTNFRH